MKQVQTDVSAEGSLGQAVIESIADAEDTDPTELTPPLYEVIDPDALDGLFANDRALGKIIFNYNDYEVTVFPDGYVSVKNYNR